MAHPHNARTSILLLLLSLIALSAPLTFQFQKSISDEIFRTSFNLGYITAGNTLDIIVKPQQSGYSYKIIVWRPGQSLSRKDLPFEQAGPFTNTKLYTTKKLDVSSVNWRVQIIPVGDPFMITVDFKTADKVLGSYAALASSKRIFTLYNTNIDSFAINVNLYSGNIADLTTTIYGPFSSISYSGGNPVKVPSIGSSSASLLYTGAANSYYYITMEPTEALLKTSPLFLISFQTDQYQCPYSSSLKDPNEHFAGCSTQLPTRGFPCINFDNQLDKCMYCSHPYLANEKGVCIMETGCNNNQYVQFGQCYTALKNCVDFDKFGGNCFACAVGYDLIRLNNYEQQCKLIPPTCKESEYLVDNKCKQKVQNCAQFVSLTGKCEACEATFNLVNNVCYAKTADFSCPQGQAKYSGVCKRIDPKCVFVDDVSGDCLLCAKGYKWQNKECRWIQCGPRQYNGLGVCIDISLACGDAYDNVNGNCLSCKDPEVNVLTNQGKCVQTILNAQEVQTESCQDRYVKKGDTCVEVSSLCDGYDKTTGDCTSCKDTNNYFLQAGKCIKIDGYCKEPRTFFQDGQCKAVSPTCDTFNKKNGHCIQCIDRASKVNDGTGRCLYNDICVEAQRQYKKQDGSCGTVDAKCGTWLADGTCTACASSYDLNGSGICCLRFNYLADPQCKQYHQQNCASLDRLDFCEVCQSGYAKSSDGFGGEYYYSKCKPVA